MTHHERRLCGRNVVDQCRASDECCLRGAVRTKCRNNRCTIGYGSSTAKKRTQWKTTSSGFSYLAVGPPGCAAYDRDSAVRIHIGRAWLKAAGI